MRLNCAVDGCARPPWAQGLCHTHYNRSVEPERNVEKRCTTRAKSAGYLAWKFTVLNVVGVPDRIFLGHGRVFFVEFKKLNKTARLKQRLVINKMRAHGVEVYVVDNVEAFDKILNQPLTDIKHHGK